MHDLPEVRLIVQEHQVEEVLCPLCQKRSAASFPAGIQTPVQYGPNMRALAVYLQQYQLVPLARTCELLADLYGCQVSEGTLTTWVQQGAEALAPTVAHIAELLKASRLHHADETGVDGGSRVPPRTCLTTWLSRADQVLAFLDELAIPFTNNQAERDLRMVARATKDCWNVPQ